MVIYIYNWNEYRIAFMCVCNTHQSCSVIIWFSAALSLWIECTHLLYGYLLCCFWDILCKHKHTHRRTCVVFWPIGLSDKMVEWTPCWRGKGSSVRIYISMFSEHNVLAVDSSSLSPPPVSHDMLDTYSTVAATFITQTTQEFFLK